MSNIFGGNSGVTLLSRRLGGGAFTDIGRPTSFPLDGLVSETYTTAAFTGVSTAARAHLYSKIVVATPPDQWKPKHLDFIQTARNFRPTNAFLQLVEVCVISRVIGAAEGERAACTFLAEPSLELGIEPDMGFSFLMGGADYFPTGMVAGLSADAGPATALLVALGQAVSDHSHRRQALIALAKADAALAPAAIAPALLERLLFCLSDCSSE
jgi:hypothetical protein